MITLVTTTDRRTRQRHQRRPDQLVLHALAETYPAHGACIERTTWDQVQRAVTEALGLADRREGRADELRRQLYGLLHGEPTDPVMARRWRWHWGHK